MSASSTPVDASGEPIPTSSVLMAASKHIAVRCRPENVAFLNCKKKDPNPEKCLEKGRQVTRCVFNLVCAGMLLFCELVMSSAGYIELVLPFSV
uniref:CHCH domain-containing protein n=1 Tax=Aegilops tauschii subsp. strangulata TaxID=200361 RepID=A0A453IAP6_AEGTS